MINDMLLITAEMARYHVRFSILVRKISPTMTTDNQPMAGDSPVLEKHETFRGFRGSCSAGAR
jgi:hypothetical protein